MRCTRLTRSERYPPGCSSCGALALFGSSLATARVTARAMMLAAAARHARLTHAAVLSSVARGHASSTASSGGPGQGEGEDEGEGEGKGEGEGEDEGQGQGQG